MIGSRSSAAAAWRYLKNELSEAIRRLRVLGAAPSATSWSRQAWTSATDGLQQRDRVVGPGDLAEGDEGHDVLAVGALGVFARAAGDPGLEDAGDREEETVDAFLDLVGCRAGEDRRQVADDPLGEDEDLGRSR